MKKFKFPIEDSLRRLARSSHWITLYNRSKEIGSIKLFNNDSDYSSLQVNFLRWLELMSGLYMDIALGEEFISEQVIEDEIRTNAYLFYKSKKREEEKLKKNQPQGSERNSIVFVPKKKQRK